MKKVLIIDDNDIFATLISDSLPKEEYVVVHAINGLQGMELIKRENPDLILLDIMMPGMDGFELLEKMKQDNICQSSIRIILSNRGQQSDIVRGESLGASGYIVKASSTPSEVITKVSEIITSKAKA